MMLAGCCLLIYIVKIGIELHATISEIRIECRIKGSGKGGCLLKCDAYEGFKGNFKSVHLMMSAVACLEYEYGCEISGLVRIQFTGLG